LYEQMTSNIMRMFTQLAMLVLLFIALLGCSTCSRGYELNKVEDVKIVNGLLCLLVRSERGANNAEPFSHNTALKPMEQSFFLLKYSLGTSNQLMQPNSSELVFRYTEGSKIVLSIVDDKTFVAQNIQRPKLECAHSFVVLPAKFQITERTYRNGFATTRSERHWMTQNGNDEIEIVDILTKRVEEGGKLKVLTSLLTPQHLKDTDPILTDDLKYVILRHAEDMQSRNYRVYSSEGATEKPVPFLVWAAESIDGELHLFGMDYAEEKTVARIRNVNTGEERTATVPSGCGNNPVWDYHGGRLLFHIRENIVSGITSARSFRQEYALWDYVNNRVNTVKILVAIGQQAEINLNDSLTR
jgi:hypothetical protein